MAHTSQLPVAEYLIREFKDVVKLQLDRATSQVAQGLIWCSGWKGRGPWDSGL